eukprot:6174267-Pyramimonas_sp.AAC.1
MQARQQNWQKIWTDQVDTMDDIIHGLTECHKQALEEDPPPITLQELDVASAKMSAKKAKGVDNISVNDVARLPVVGRQKFVDFLNDVE